MEKTQAHTLAALCEQLVLMLGAGMPLHESIDALGAGEDESARLFTALAEPLRCGSTLHEAMALSGCFPTEMIGMVRAGEQSGQLERVLEGLAAHYSRMHRLSRAVSDAVRYPLMLLIIMSLVIVVLVFQVMPIFERALCSLGAGMDGFSQHTMVLARGIGFVLFGLCALLLIGAVVGWISIKNGKRPNWIFRIRPVARLRRLYAAQRLSSTLSVLLSSGMAMETALEMSAEGFEDAQEREHIRTCAQSVADGMDFSAALGSGGWFEPLYIRMVQAGIASGQTDTALAKTAQMISQEIDDALSRMLSLIEPAMMIVLGAMIGSVLLCVLAPISGVLSAMV